MNRLVELLFKARGMTPATFSAYDNDEHDVLQGTEEFCTYMRRAHDLGKQITVLPDFDMDGIMSGVVGLAGLCELGFDARLFVPNPQAGFGFSAPEVDRLLDLHPHTQVILSCDTGISCVEGTRHARRLGRDVIITDHHMEEPESSSRSVANLVIDPCAVGETYSHPGICGAHVLWQCLDAYARTYCSRETIDRIARLRVFAGIGTVSDMMPLLYENRQLVRDAVSITRLVGSQATPWFLQSLSGTPEYEHAFRGLSCVVDAFHQAGKITSTDDIDEGFFGFYMAPAFNSVKRMDGDMRRAFGVFFGDDAVGDAQYLINLNAERRVVTEMWWDEMTSQSNTFAPLIYVTKAPKGLLGLLAARAMELSGLPCMVVTPDGSGGFSGSGRSPAWYPFIDRTENMGFFRAGHQGAFGVGFKDQAILARISRELADDIVFAREMLAPEEGPVFDFTIATDGSGDVGIDIVMFAEFLEQMSIYHPFGQGFPTPSILLRFNMGDDEVRCIRMGSEGQHLKLVLPQGLNVVSWNQGGLADQLSGDVQVAGCLEWNNFRGESSVQFSGSVIV